MTTTFRADVVTGLYTTLTDFITANPTLLRRAYRARPPAIRDLPAAYIESRPEAVRHTAHVRSRTMSPSVVVIDRLTDNAETAARLDALVDALLDAFTASVHILDAAAGRVVWNGSMDVSDEAFAIGETEFAAVRFTFADIQTQEGRA